MWQTYRNSLLLLGSKEEFKCLQGCESLEFYIHNTYKTSHGTVEGSKDQSAEECNCSISLVVPSEIFSCSQALVIWEVLHTYVIFGRLAKYYKMLNWNLFSFENPFL